MNEDNKGSTSTGPDLEGLSKNEYWKIECKGHVSYLLGEGDADTETIIDLIVEEGYPLEVSSELLDADVPPFSTSLDAKLPGEKVVLVMYASRKDQWVAIHRSSDGNNSVAWARTECLARRAAALKGKWAQTKVLVEIARGVEGEDDPEDQQ